MKKTKTYSILALVSLLTMITAMGIIVPAKAAPTTSLIGQWDFDEGTGVIALDSSGNGNHGNLTGGPTWVPRDTGYALSFDGVDDVIYINNEENFDFNYDDAFSIEAMFKTESDEMMSIVSKLDLDFPHRGFELLKHDSSNGNALYFFLVNTYLSASSGNLIRCFGSTDVADGEWHHVVVTYDGSGSVSGVNIYLDGVPETIGSTIGTVSADTTNDLYVQISGREGTHYVFYGSIDEVKIWGAELQTPIADANGPYTGDEGSPISFDGSGSYDPDGTIVLYEWDLDDDGQYDDATGVTTTHTWFDDYSGVIGLRVTDDQGFTDTDSTTVTVNNVAPSIDSITGDTINENGVATVSGTFSDPGTLDTFMVTIDWGEGGPEVYSYPAGSTSFSETHQYLDDDPTGTASDVYSVSVTVIDDDTGSDSVSTSVIVNNVAPSVDAGSDQTVDEGDTVSLSGIFLDPGTEDSHTIDWDFGDGDTELDSTLTPTHVYGDNGEYTVTLTVTDDDGGTGSDTLKVTVNNVAPSANAGPDKTALINQAIAFTGIGTDPGSDDLEFMWDWGDGSPNTITQYYNDGVSPDPYPSPDGNYPFQINDAASHMYSSSGVYIVTLTVTDDDGGSSSDSVRVVVLPYSDLTNSGLCPDFDREPETEGDQFRLIFTPDLNGDPKQYKISTTNPGQFYYNIFHVGEVSPGNPFTISIPYPFVTQGANPIHVYDGADINEYGCYVPGVDISAQFDITRDGNEILVTPLSSDSGVYYINVHLEYGLKQDGEYEQHLYRADKKWYSHADKYGAIAIMDLTDHTFSVSGPVTDSQTMQNRNAFKKIRGIAGFVEGAPEGFIVTISGGVLKKPVEVKVDEDGFYGYSFHHKGKIATYTVDAGIYGTKQVQLKAGRFAEVNFP